MSKRAWRWAVISLVAGLLFLALAINSRVGWQPPSNDHQMVMTVGQLLGMLSGAALAVIGGGMVLHGIRVRRAERHARIPQAEPPKRARLRRSSWGRSS